MKLQVTAALCLFWSPAFAWDVNDYEQVMKQNADKVVTQTNADGSVERILDLGDGVVVSCSEDGCYGIDQGEVGAIGCFFSIVGEIRVVDAVCDLSLEKKDAQTLQDLFDTTSAYVAENAVPHRTSQEMDALLDSKIEQFQNFVADNPLACVDARKPGSDIRMMMLALSDPATASDLSRAFSSPRLPVMNPCL